MSEDKKDPDNQTPLSVNYKHKSRSAPTEDDIFDCETCGAENTVSFVPNYRFIDEALKLDVEVPAYVCSACDDEGYSDDVYIKLSEMQETAMGRPYVRVRIKDGKIIKYSVQ